MNPEFWHKQTTDQPLYPDMLWSRPENRTMAGKLLIVGGNLHGFRAPAEAYAEAEKAGIGVSRVLLPDALQKTLGRSFEAGEFTTSTPSGSLGVRALADLLAMANWADGTLVAGGLGRNSETAILLEKFVGKYPGQLTISGDAVDYFISNPTPVLDRPDTLLALNIQQLQKLAAAAKFPTAFTSDMDILRLVAALHDFSNLHPSALILEHLENIFVITDGQVSSTTVQNPKEDWQTAIAAHASTWWLQNPSKTFEALTTSLLAD